MNHESSYDEQRTPEDEGQFMHARDSVEPDRDLFGNAPKHHRDWSHRRGEPRVMALCWMIYLMGATIVMFASMSRAHTISLSITRPAAQTMMLLIVFGFSILWPMLRLSQRHPMHGHVWFVLRDVFVLFVPLQAVLWPQVSGILANWSYAAVGSISLMCGCWMILIAGVLALALRSIARRDTALNRGVWMTIVVSILIAAPMIGVLGQITPPVPIDQPRVGWLMSPFTAVLELVRDREATGAAVRIYPAQVRMLIAIGCVGLALLLIARALEVAQARVRA